MVAQLIADLDVRMPIRLVGKDRYLVGTRIKTAVIKDNTVAFRVGGGYMLFTEYVAKYEDTEVARLKLKILQTGDTLEGLVSKMILRVNQKAS